MTEPIPQFLLKTEEGKGPSRLGSTFLVSAILHVAAIAFVITHPEAFTSRTRPVVLVDPERLNVTPLYEPPPPQTRAELTMPPPEREVRPEPPLRAEAQSQRILPPVRQLPRMEGSPFSETEPRPSRGGGNQGQGEGLEAKQLPPIGIPEFPTPPTEAPQGRASLEPVPTPKSPPPEQAELRLPNLALPGRGTEAILREMARQHAEGRGSRGFGGIPPSDSSNPDFNLPGPQILSDTMGVDFDPYLLRVYLIVRRNWYSVIPEIARLGRKGRVVLEFAIQRNGNVPELQLVSGSGTESLDSAALASVRLSNPFPPLPTEYPAGEIRLRFGYFYNMQPTF